MSLNGKCAASTFGISIYSYDINQYQRNYREYDINQYEKVTPNSSYQTIVLNTYSVTYKLYDRILIEPVEASSPFKALKAFLNSVSDFRKNHLQILKIV